MTGEQERRERVTGEQEKRGRVTGEQEKRESPPEYLFQTRESPHSSSALGTVCSATIQTVKVADQLCFTVGSPCTVDALDAACLANLGL